MPKNVDHDAERSRLAEAAVTVISGQGLDATGLRQVASAADQTTGALTHYFTSKAALIEAAYDAVMARLLVRQAELVDAVDPATLAAQLATVLPGDADATRDWRVWLAFSARALVDDSMQARHRAYYARITTTLAADIAAAGGSDGTAAAGGGDAAAMADLLVAVLDGLGVRMLLEPGEWPTERVMAVLTRLAAPLFDNDGRQ